MKKRIIILICISIVVILILGIFIILNKNQKDMIIDEGEESKNQSSTNIIKPIENNTQLFTVQGYIQNFIEQINVNNVIYFTGGERIDQSIIEEKIYNLLSTDFIEKNSIKKDNVYEYVNKLEEKLTFIPIKINMIECKNTVKYSIYGFTQTQSNEYKENVYFILNVDNKNNTYSIEPVTNVKSIDEIELTTKDLEIEPNRYNKYKEKEITEEYICQEYLYMYKRMMLSKTQEAYNNLNEEYKNKRFGSFENFTTFVENNKDMINKIILKAYSVKNNEYMCEDQRGNYYVFYINKVLDYKVVLDLYTIDLPEFKGKYSKANDQEKVVLNIGKVIAAINNEDYKYVYSKLSDSFKNNYFNNEDALKEFLQKNIYRKNEVKCDEFEREGNIYTYKVRIIKKDEEGEEIPQGKDAPYRKFNIVMQLKEESDFVMSFSIDE